MPVLVMFHPYILRSVTRARRAVEALAISTRTDVEQLLIGATKEESLRFEDDAADDAEGEELSLDPAPQLSGSPSDVNLGEASTILPEPFPQSPPSQTAEKKCRRRHAKEQRQVKRQHTAEQSQFPDTYVANPSLVGNILGKAQTTKLTGDIIYLPTTSGGSWTGKRQPSIRDKPWTVEKLRQLKFCEIEWNGIDTILFLDNRGRIVAILVGRPNNPEWSEICVEAAAILEDVRETGITENAFPKKYMDHRRGDFVALPVGVSFGGGQKLPGNLVHSKTRQRLLNRLLSSKSIQRIARFQSSAFAAYAPKLYRYYATVLRKLFDFYQGLQHNFRNSIFPATSFNLGPSTVALDHIDYGNLLHGLCALTALGNFDPITSGHFIFFEFGVFVQFPPGATILAPSGCLAHGNTPLEDGETRLSITQYAAGGLFRWVEYGFQKVETLLQTADGRRRKFEADMKEGKRWKWGIHLFSKYKSLASDVQKVFDSR